MLDGRLVKLRKVAGASRWHLVDIDENSFLRIARIEGQHTMVDVLLQTFASIASSESAARCSRKQTGLDPLRLRVSWPGNILHDDAPFTVSVHGTNGAGVKDIAGTDVSLVANPVTLFEGTAVIVGIIKVLFRQRCQAID